MFSFSPLEVSRVLLGNSDCNQRHLTKTFNTAQDTIKVPYRQYFYQCEMGNLLIKVKK